MPRLGGIAIFASVVLALLSLTLVNNALTQNLRPELKSIGSVSGLRTPGARAGCL